MPHAIRIHKTGGPEVLKWEEVEVGDPGPGQVRLRQEAAGLNFIDVYHRTGLYKQQLPFTPGVEGAGVVEAVGAGRHQREGRRPRRLCRADRRLCRGAADRRRPGGEAARRDLVRAGGGNDAPGHDRADAAARGPSRSQPGETILVHAAAGGVGLIVCQWAKALGATVIGTVGSDEKAELARAHGCDHPIVYTRAGLRRRGRAGSPTARSCRSSMIRSAATPS